MFFSIIKFLYRNIEKAKFIGNWYYSLNNNDILIARTGGTIGKSYIVKRLGVVFLFASYLIRVIPSSVINPDFF